MKIIPLLILLFFSFQTNAQLGSNLWVEGLLGIRLNILSQHSRPSAADFLVTSPLMGIKISHKEYPFSLSFMHDRSYFFRHYPVNESYDIHEINKGNMLRIQYQAKRFHYGIGHYWYAQKGAIDFLLPGWNNTDRYIAFMLALPIGRAEIEFQSLMRYTLFDVGDRYLQEVNFKYHFGGQKNKEKTYPTKYANLIFSLGGRFFLPDQPFLMGEEKVILGTAGAIGIEILVAKFRTGLYWQKDWWIALNGGSPTRAIKGQITNNVFGLKYYHPLKKNRSFNVGIGGAWIMDASTQYETIVKITNGEASEKLRNNNIRGIAIAPSFNFNKNFEIELRQIIATQGEKGFDLERLSLGMFYKIQP